MSARALAEFLRDRRDRLNPFDLGIANGTPRRTPGLRRDEVAERSGMSTEYYTQLEQGRGARPSHEMLDAMAMALRLSRAEHDHLYHLAGEGPRPERRIPSEPDPSLVALLERMSDTAAILIDAKQQLLAWNRFATRLMEDFSQTPEWNNLARRFFLHPEKKKQHFGMNQSEPYARYLAAELRAADARYPNDPELRKILAELREKSPHFERLWQSGEVYQPRHMQKRVVHDVLGPLVLWCNMLIVPEYDQRVVFFTAKPRTRSARLLRSLGTKTR